MKHKTFLSRKLLVLSHQNLLIVNNELNNWCLFFCLEILYFSKRYTTITMAFVSIVYNKTLYPFLQFIDFVLEHQHKRVNLYCSEKNCWISLMKQIVLNTIFCTPNVTYLRCYLFCICPMHTKGLYLLKN